MDDILIDLEISKEPYIKQITDDKVVNITGQSGAGKSTYVSENFNSDEYIVIDTDDILNEKRFINSKGMNKELGIYLRSKYEILPDLSIDFDLIYSEIIEYCKKYDKVIVIDCAQYHCVKDIDILKGKIIILRTSINECYKRCIERFKKIYPDYSEEELENYKKRKYKIFDWFNSTNDFILKIENIDKII